MQARELCTHMMLWAHMKELATDARYLFKAQMQIIGLCIQWNPHFLAILQLVAFDLMYACASL